MPPKASESEMTVLALLIAKGKATAMELHADLAKRHNWAPATVITFLRRLEEKELVSHVKPRSGRAFLFKPTRKARSSGFSALEDLMRRVFGGDPLPMVSSLLDSGSLKEDELLKLRQLIDERLDEKETK